jgi:hypothetical protein
LPYGIYFIQLKNSKTVYQYKIYIYWKGFYEIC